MNRKFAKGAVAGAIGGLAASYAMNQFQALWKAVEKTASGEEQPSSGSDDVTVKTAEAISQSVCDHQLNDAEKKWAGPAVHFGFGTLPGVAYGLLAETLPVTGSGRGTAYGDDRRRYQPRLFLKGCDRVQR
jgi:hypothetical protein